MAAKPSSTAIAPTIEEILSYPILLSDHIVVVVNDPHIFQFQCYKIGKQVNRLCHMLRSAGRLASSSTPFYDSPLRRIAAQISLNLEKSLTLAKKCRRLSTLLRRALTIVSTNDFNKLFLLLDSSIADMKWFLSIYEANNGGIPPIAIKDPILSWVWSFIASLHNGQLRDKIEAAGMLLYLAKDNDRNKQMIVDEGGVLPLLKLLKDNSSPDGQFAASSTLFHLSNSQERVQAIIDGLGIPIVVQTLNNSSMKVQIGVSNLVVKVAEHCPLEDYRNRLGETTKNFNTTVDTDKADQSVWLTKPIVSKAWQSSAASASAESAPFAKVLVEIDLLRPDDPPQYTMEMDGKSYSLDENIRKDVVVKRLKTSASLSITICL
ncbi:hypothetical protein CASFOL_021489 [Castilleja foliolosa]|uniref:DUF7792 domain-containing protein n=1 Tax=Castilleja foliolosa TaxID=1961234 RepID=A0ABD3D0G9_9LAMI